MKYLGTYYKSATARSFDNETTWANKAKHIFWNTFI